MKKVLFAFLLMPLTLLLSFFSPECLAVGDAELSPEDSAALDDAVPDDARDGLERFGINVEEPETITELSPSDVFSAMADAVRSRLGAPLRLFAAICALGALSSVVGKFSGSALITAAAGAYIVCEPVAACLSSCAAVISVGSGFMRGFVPIFAGICAMSGNLTSSASYGVLMLTAVQGAVFVADKVLMPLTGMCAALSIVGAMNPAISFSSLLAGVKKTAVWILGAVMTIFTGLLAVQSVVGAAADSLAVRTGRFLASSLIPVVGGAVSEAYSTLSGSMSLLKGTTGVFGIAVLLSCLLPVIISAALYCLAVSLGGAVAELFGAAQLGKLCKDIVSALELALAVVICFSVLMIISTAILMTIRS